EDVVAPRDVPVWAVAGCDGYAVRAADLGAALSTPSGAGTREVTLPVVADVPVTTAEPLRLVSGTTVLIAAGGPLPAGADAVVPLDHTDRGRAQVTIRGPVEPGDHVRPAGQDVAVGVTVLRAGTRLAPRHLAVAAALGRGRLRVHPAPRVVVLSIGDELVEPGRNRSPGRVHDVDNIALAAAVRETGAHAVRVGPIGDDRVLLREALADQLVRADLIVLTGGLSSGPWDTVTDVLAPLGTVRFDQVAMTPGHRQGFGTVRAEDSDGDVRHATALAVGNGDGVPVFALPGHPVAAMVSYEVFVRPALRTMAGYADLYRPSVRAASAQPWRSPSGRRQFVPATVVGSPTEGYVAHPVGDPGQVSLGSLATANALAVVGEDTTTVRAGDTLACLVLDG
ncbi:gephyrin-like molybdotransferase Glp, partial [Actinotalea sp.]|uniref:molybdopterin molybdotransferase MoeA n=1 Tax=Actinotalea sp. TaxID=1872145 RepID=UPI003564EAA0